MDSGLDRLVRELQRPTRRCRVGILLLAPEHLGAENDLAARLHLTPRDYREVLMQSVIPGSSFVGIDPQREEIRLDGLAKIRDLDYRCLLVYNYDLALSRLDPSEREILWANLRSNFPYRPNSLLLAVPQSAAALLPSGNERTAWEAEGRIAYSTGFDEGVTG